MKKDIILAGVGGQGILTIAAAIGFAAIEAGLAYKAVRGARYEPERRRCAVAFAYI